MISRKELASKVDLKLTSQYYFFIGLVIFVANIAVKAYRIDRHDFWFDEIVSVFTSQQNFNRIIFRSTWNVNPPFFYFILHYWIKLFGIGSEATIRMLSVLLSSGAGVMLFYTARKHFNLRTAIIASFIFLFHGAAYRYAQEARCFSLVLLLSVVSFHFFFNFLKTEKVKWLVFLSLIDVILFYTHYITIYIPLFQAIAYLLLYQQRRKGLYLLIPVIIFLLSISFWTDVLLNLATGSNGNSSWIQPPGSYHLKTAIRFFFQREFILMLVLATTLIIFIPKLRFEKSIKFKTALLAIWAFAPLITGFIISQYYPMFVNRYFLFCLPGVILLVSYTVANIRFAYFHWWGSIALISFFFLSFSPVDFSSNIANTSNLASLFINKTDHKNTLYLVDGQCAAIAYYQNKEWFKDYENLEGNLLNKNIVAISSSEPIDRCDFSGFKEIKVYQEPYDKPQSKNIIDALYAKFELLSDRKIDNVRLLKFSNPNYDSLFTTSSITEFDRNSDTFWQDTSLLHPLSDTPGDGKGFILTPISPYSSLHDIDLSDYRFTPVSKMTVDYWVKQSKIDNHILQVIELKDSENDAVTWSYVSTRNFMKAENVWHHIHKEFPLSLNFSKFDKITTYFWASANDGKTIIDRVKFTLSGIVKKETP